jgi:prophage regulatory protein
VVNDDVRPGALPETGFVREKQLVNQPAKGGQPERAGIVAVSHATLWRMVATKRFPAPIKLSEGVTAWRVEDVRQWLAKITGHAAAG